MLSLELLFQIMERRKFIGLSAYTAIAFSLPIVGGCMQKPIDKNFADPALFRRITGEKNIRETGEDYLKQFPAEKDQRKLAELLTQGSESPDASDAARLNEFFDKRIKDDFKSGRTVVANGWVLSLTEARQCALYTLLEPAK
jgi:hypothetical protein